MATVAGKPTASRESSRESTHSGRLLLRMPRALHAQLAARAEADGLSLNQYIVDTLTKAPEGTSSPAQGSADGKTARSVRLALLANAVVVAFAAATCVALLVAVWR